MSNRNVAVVASGGLARRMGSLVPKPLLEVSKSSYLEILLDEISDLGFDAVILLCNRREYLEVIKEKTISISNLSIVFDSGVQSTYELVKIADTLSPNSVFTFFYGHAPRPERDINQIKSSSWPISVSAYSNSTKRTVIKSKKNNFIEPPYKIDSSKVNLQLFNSWSEFFSCTKDMTEVNFFSSPCEFNYSDEEVVYRNYVVSEIINHRKGLLTKSSSGPSAA